MKEPIASEVSRRPFHLLVLADLGCARPMAQPICLTSAEDLPAFLASHGPKLAFQVPDLVGGTEHLDVELSISDFRGFEPQRIVSAVAPLTRAAELLSQLQTAVKGGRPVESIAPMIAQHADLAGLAPMLAAIHQCLDPTKDPTPAASTDAEADGAGVDRLLQLADLPDQQQQASSTIDKIARAVSQKRQQRAARHPEERLSLAIDQLAELVGRQLATILHHPSFQAAESAWRGLRFLVRRTNLRKPILLDVMHVTRRDLRDGLPLALKLATEAPQRNTGPDLVAAAFLLQEPNDAELLQELAETADLRQTPLLLSVAGSFVGLSADGRTPGWSTLFDEPRYIKWNSLRRKDCARWLTPVLNRFLLREPYDGRRESHGGLTERCTNDADYLWGDPVWAIASLLTHSVATTGWPTQILGQHDGAVPDLPVRKIVSNSGRAAAPVEFLLPAPAVDDLARQGFALLAGVANSDTAFLRMAPTSFRTDAEPRPRATALPYQLLVTRIVRLIEGYRATAQCSSADALRAELQRLLLAEIADSGFGASVDLSVDEEGGRYRVAIELRTGRGVLGGVPVELNLFIG